MSETLASTPAEDGFRMPAEFEPHSGCWMIWPERPDNWRLGAKPAQEAFAAVAEAINVCDPVTIGVSERQFEHCRASLSPSIRVVELSSDDAWIRDTGPSFVLGASGASRGVDWQFNAWGGLNGGLYFPWDHDERVARKVLEVERAGRYAAPIVLEGGAIHVDGQGTVMATEECLLNPNRNPRLSREQIERTLFDYLGADSMIWLGRGAYNDETDGHVDNLACFAAPGVVLLTGARTARTRCGRSRAMRRSDSRAPSTPAAGRWRSSRCPCPARSRSPRRRRAGWNAPLARCPAVQATVLPPPT